MTTQLIGIDCATVEEKIGIASAELIGTDVVVREARRCAADEKAADIVVRWLRKDPFPRALLAIDAPLGWPKELSDALFHHRAGREISTEPNMLFRRETDRFVQTTLGKTPLDIGADRIARTAHSALRLLSDVRREMQADIPLAWSPDWAGTAAVEVYPAATLLAHNMTAAGYKKPLQTVERRGIIRGLCSHLSLPADHHAMIESADALDAVVCVLAGADFARGRAHKPGDFALAQREGWIWFQANTEAG